MSTIPWWKLLLDKTGALVGLVVLSPVMLMISLGVLLTSRGPLLYKQQRVGRHGRLFTIIKFRTMIVNSDHNSVSVVDDGRATRFGAWLRRTKLDELPELWNVLRGDMSFVGPRPDVPGFADTLQGEERRILELRPGLTGLATLKYAREEFLLAQVKDPIRYNTEVIWPDKVRINLEYLDHQSLWRDLEIIWRTVLRQYGGLQARIEPGRARSAGAAQSEVGGRQALRNATGRVPAGNVSAGTVDGAVKPVK
jgi:lipopolysaccharide/colanic/teichoic acid biosynthesis glycosyltransferase